MMLFHEFFKCFVLILLINHAISLFRFSSLRNQRSNSRESSFSGNNILFKRLLLAGSPAQEIDEKSNEKSFSFSPSHRISVETIVKETLSEMNLFLVKMVWISDRLEIVVSISYDIDNLEGPSIDILNSVHSKIYSTMELNEELNNLLTQCEVLVSSPGVSDVLKSDRDFISFKGFPVIVTTKEEFKKKLEFTGTLVSRDNEMVSVSQKGRVTKIPRDIVAEVKLPKAKYESFDEEIKKLQ